MFRKALYFWGRHPFKVFFAGAFLGFAYLAILASGFGAVEGRNSGFTTLTQPSSGPIKAPQPQTIGATTELASGGEKARVEGCDHLLLKVGSDHVLSEDYVPGSLIYLSSYGISTRGAEDMLRPEAAERLGFLLSDAAGDGVEVLVASGYRSYREQSGTYEWFKDAYGEEAGKLSVPPGHSEHQLGTAVDFTSSQVDYELVTDFGQTAAGSWLKKNAARHGFALSYPDGREREVGVRHEPWHYRYVGVEKALQVEASRKGAASNVYREGRPQCYES